MSRSVLGSKHSPTFFFFSSRRRHTRCLSDWSSDVCSSDLHRNVVNFLSSMRRKPGLTAEDVWLAVTTLSFDFSVLELYLPLLVGAKVVLASREQASDPEQLRGLLASSKITAMSATPATRPLVPE